MNDPQVTVESTTFGWVAWVAAKIHEAHVAEERARNENYTLRQQLAAKDAEISNLKGAMAAQDERERKAGERCCVPYEIHACDWPDWAAEKILEQDALLERARKALTAYANKGNWTCARCGGNDEVNCSLRVWVGPRLQHAYDEAQEALSELAVKP